MWVVLRMQGLTLFGIQQSSNHSSKWDFNSVFQKFPVPTEALLGAEQDLYTKGPRKFDWNTYVQSVGFQVNARFHGEQRAMCNGEVYAVWHTFGTRVRTHARASAIQCSYSKMHSNLTNQLQITHGNSQSLWCGQTGGAVVTCVLASQPVTWWSQHVRRHDVGRFRCQLTLSRENSWLRPSPSVASVASRSIGLSIGFEQGTTIFIQFQLLSFFNLVLLSFLIFSSSIW